MTRPVSITPLNESSGDISVIGVDVVSLGNHLQSVYHIFVTAPKPKPPSLSSKDMAWLISRTYDEFVDLDEILKRNSSSKVPSLGCMQKVYYSKSLSIHVLM